MRCRHLASYQTRDRNSSQSDGSVIRSAMEEDIDHAGRTFCLRPAKSLAKMLAAVCDLYFTEPEISGERNVRNSDPWRPAKETQR